MFQTRVGVSSSSASGRQDTYERVTRCWDHDTLTTLKGIQNHPSDLTMLGFLERSRQNKRRAGGAHYQYELTLDP
nr:hypothetical protein [Halorubrum coriense]